MMPLTMSGTNYDYDYDVIQPFFLDGEEEDFYLPPHRQLLPGPDEDIWKKFELLPTPPVSPSRTSSPCAAPLSAEDHLEAVYELLDEDHTSTSLLQSFIIQDCMWSSSFAAAAKLERVVSARLECLRARRESSAADSVVPGASDSQPDRPQMDSEYLKDVQAAASDCIDPSEVFQQTQGGNAAGLDSPPISSSDSESEEEEMDNDEEEEVDVVTVEGQRTCRRPDASPLVLKRSHINTHQHNYAAQQPARKRAKPASSAAKPGGGRRCWSPRSDGEDDDKRRTHNVLERQRRNELRRSFLALRDHIPAVAGNEKAAKVAILKTATEFIAEIQEDERRLLAAKEELRSRSRELRRRLEQLRT